MSWQTSQTWRGPVLFDDVVTQPTGSFPGGLHSIGPWDIRPYEGIAVTASNMTNGCQLLVQSAMDSAFTISLPNEDVYILRHESAFRAVMPVLGNWARLTVLVPPGLATFTGTLFVQAVNGMSPPRFPGPTQGIYATSVNTNPGDHLQYWLPNVSPGPAQFVFSPSTNAYWAQIFASDAGANINASGQVFALTNPPAAPSNQQVILPPGPVWVDIMDRSAPGTVGNAFSFGLTPGGPL